MSVAPADPQVSHRCGAAWAGLPSAFKNVAAMLRLSFDPEQIALCAAKRDAFRQHSDNRGVQARKFVFG